MPKSKRDKVKEKHDAAINAVVRATVYALELADMFAEHHADYTEGYNSIVIMLLQTRAFIEKMKGFI